MLKLSIIEGRSGIEGEGGEERKEGALWYLLYLPLISSPPLSLTYIKNIKI
jgi:hypothetical protein